MQIVPLLVGGIVLGGFLYISRGNEISYEKSPRNPVWTVLLIATICLVAYVWMSHSMSVSVSTSLVSGDLLQRLEGK